MQCRGVVIHKPQTAPFKITRQHARYACSWDHVSKPNCMPITTGPSKSPNTTGWTARFALVIGRAHEVSLTPSTSPLTHPRLYYRLTVQQRPSNVARQRRHGSFRTFLHEGKYLTPRLQPGRQCNADRPAPIYTTNAS